MKKTPFEVYKNYVLSLSPQERVSITEYLRRQYLLIKNKPIDLAVKSNRNRKLKISKVSKA